MIGERLAHAVNFAKQLELQEGDTLFVVRRIPVEEASVKGGPFDYEGVITNVVAPKGVVVHERADEVKIEKTGGQAEIVFRYAIHVEAGTKTGGPIKLTLKLLERVGFSNALASVPLTQTIEVLPSKATQADVAADFAGYRVYRALAETRMNELQAARVEGLTLKDRGPLPGLDRFEPKTVAAILEFDKWRRRAWVAVRHLQAAAKGSDLPAATLARQYIPLLNAPDEKLTGLPDIAFAGDGGSGEASVETLKPEPKAAPPAGGDGAKPAPKAGATKDGVLVLKPLGEANDGEGEDGGRTAAPGADTRAKPAATAGGAKPVTAKEPKTELVDAGILAERSLSRETPIPTYPRALTLDDPNIGWGGAVRASYARVSTRETATTPAFFFLGQVALVKDLGLEISIPTSYVKVSVDRAPGLFSMGNPLVAAKYRLHLPDILGRRPVITVRARYGLPLQPLHALPPTDLGAEDFALPAHFADTYAFLLEKHDFGLGFSAAWMWKFLHVSGQAYGDYYLAVADSANKQSFAGISYGVSVGVRPFGDVLGAYAELRSSSLLVGPGRRQGLAYLGARGRFLGWLEPAAWIALPLNAGSGADSLQFGGELRFAYDVESVIVRGKERAEGEELLGQE